MVLQQVKIVGKSAILMKISHFDLAVTLTLTFCEKIVLIFCKTDTIQIIFDRLIFNKYVKENLADVFIDLERATENGGHLGRHLELRRLSQEIKIYAGSVLNFKVF